jgi:hypothetical protein
VQLEGLGKLPVTSFGNQTHDLPTSSTVPQPLYYFIRYNNKVTVGNGYFYMVCANCGVLPQWESFWKFFSVRFVQRIRNDKQSSV